MLQRSLAKFVFELTAAANCGLRVKPAAAAAVAVKWEVVAVAVEVVQVHLELYLMEALEKK